MCNYWLIPMDFLTCNFNNLQTEWNQNNKIMWQAPGKPKYKKRDNTWYIDKNSMAKELKNGDIIYFYVYDLPAEGKQKIGRIMLRGIIEDEAIPIQLQKVYLNRDKDDTGNKIKKECTESNKNEMIIGFSIGHISTLSKERLEDNSFLSLSYLKEKYNGFMYPQGPRWPNKEYNKNLDEKLIIELEKCFKSNIQENDFNALVRHFNCDCFFCGKCGIRNDHKTFIRNNGLNYYEYHHFIPQHLAKKYPELTDIINSSANGLYLCSNCHNKFHYGTNKDINEMIRKTLDCENIKDMLNHFEFQKFIGEDEDVFEWFQKVYNTK